MTGTRRTAGARRIPLTAWIAAAAGLCIALGGCAALEELGGLLPAPSPAVEEPRPSGTAEVPDAPYAEPVPRDAIPMQVVAIVDGDTLRARVDVPGDLVTTTRPISVRLIGIDAPEVHPVLECYGHEATDALEWWLPPGSAVWVAPDVDSWDRYDRRLFYLWTEDGTFVNLALVAEGYAEAIRVEPNTSRFDDLRDAERSAMHAGIGMWGACAGG